MVPTIAIVGKSGSGKTAVMEKLVAEFKLRGLRVAAVKHAHTTVELDIRGKDTWRFSQAGADAAVLCSPGSLSIFKKASDVPSPDEAAAALGPGYDLILAEGFKNSRGLKLEVCGNGADMLCLESEVEAVICDNDLPVKIPRFGRNDITRIADFIESDILAKMPADMWLAVNSKHVPLKSFVKDIMAGSILAMVNTLKTVGVVRNVNISIRTDNK
jgi:molybdopterin-guanine dinucleotide biosynthesis protein B